MPQTTETKAATGCAVIAGGLFVAAILYALISAYASKVQLSSAVFGGFVGASLGAGVAAFVCQFTKGYLNKAQLGPLPWFGCWKRLAWLQGTYLGEAPLGRPELQAAGTRQQGPSEELATVFVVEPDEGQVTDKDSRDLARRLSLEYVDLDRVGISPAAISLVPEVVARANIILPLVTYGRELTIVVSDPEHVDLDGLRSILKQKIKIAVAPREKILAAINRCYGSGVGIL
jgi:hypothetical protein